MFATWQINEGNWQGVMKIISGITKWCNKKKKFLQFGIVAIGDGKIPFYWFVFLNSTVVEIWECSKVKHTHHRWSKFSSMFPFSRQTASDDWHNKLYHYDGTFSQLLPIVLVYSLKWYFFSRNVIHLAIKFLSVCHYILVLEKRWY